MGWLGTQTDSQNTQSPTKDQALGYCLEWASTMGPSTHDGNFVIAPMSQLGVACAMYHCLENFFGFAEADITNVECVLSNVLTSFDGADTTFPKSLTHTGTVRECAARLSWDPTNAPFWACSLRACMPKGELKDYLICTQDTYYGFEGLDQCEKLDKLVLGNIAAPIPLAITGIVFFFLAVTLYGVVSLCCSSKKSKEAKIG